jgi:hypothetical protein
MMKNKDLEKKLVVGARIRIGEKYRKSSAGLFKTNQIIELVEGIFEYDNGLYTTYQTCPAWWDEKAKEFESIYHLFENDLSDFMDCEVVE